MANREALQTQINCIREMITHILQENITLANYISTLIQEQRITIASILMAIGMPVSTLIRAVTD